MTTTPKFPPAIAAALAELEKKTREVVRASVEAGYRLADELELDQVRQALERAIADELRSAAASGRLGALSLAGLAVHEMPLPPETDARIVQGGKILATLRDGVWHVHNPPIDPLRAPR